MAADALLEPTYASVVADLGFDPETMLRVVPTSDELVAKSYVALLHPDHVEHAIAPAPGSENPTAYDGFRFREGGKVHSHHSKKEMSRCGHRTTGEELLATVVVGETDASTLCVRCWPELTVVTKTVEAESDFPSEAVIALQEDSRADQ